MTDYLHSGKTTTGQYYAELTFKLLDVIKQKQWRKLSLRSLPFSWQCTGAQVIGFILYLVSSLQLWVCSTEPSCLQSRLGYQWLFPNKKSEVPSSWNLVYRRRITEDRWEPKQKILLSGHKQKRTKVENMHRCCMRICHKMAACVVYNMLTFYSQVAKLFDRSSYFVIYMFQFIATFWH